MQITNININKRKVGLMIFVHNQYFYQRISYDLKTRKLVETSTIIVKSQKEKNGYWYLSYLVYIFVDKMTVALAKWYEIMKKMPILLAEGWFINIYLINNIYRKCKVNQIRLLFRIQGSRKISYRIVVGWIKKESQDLELKL